MLIELRIKDFLFIDDAKLEFASGLNVLTGETGSGKSMLLESISCLTKSRLGSEYIAKNKTEAYIEGTFHKSQEINNWQEKHLLNTEDDFIIISREITAKGTRNRINGKLIQSKILSELHKILFEIHLQNSQEHIFQTQGRLDFINNFLHPEDSKKYIKYQELYSQYQELIKELETKQDKTNTVQKELDYLNFQIQELDELNLDDPTEEETLANKINILNNQKEIQETIYSAYNILSGDNSDDNISLSNALYQSIKQLEKITQYDPTIEKYIEELTDIQERVSDIASELESRSNSQEDSEEDIEYINQRLQLIQKARFKHNANNLQELINIYNKLNTEIEELNNFSENLDKLKSNINNIKQELILLAQGLTKARTKLSKQLSTNINKELPGLAMEKAEFLIQCNTLDTDEFNKYGQDNIDFLLKVSKEDEFTAVTKTASGGEKSRLALLLKSLLVNTLKQQELIPPTLIFDEIDSGTSGKVAELIGQKINNIALNNQIICVTHQPLVACYADKHYSISKENISLKINLLNTQEEKITELLNLISGESDRALAQKYIENLYTKAQKNKLTV